MGISILLPSAEIYPIRFPKMLNAETERMLMSADTLRLLSCPIILAILIISDLDRFLISVEQLAFGIICVIA